MTRLQANKIYPWWLQDCDVELTKQLIKKKNLKFICDTTFLDAIELRKATIKKYKDYEEHKELLS